VTYCVGILLDEGVVLASDSRTNAGIDRVSTFRKMFTFEKPGERFFALLTAGNLSLTQGVVSLLGEWLNTEDPERDLFAVGSMFGAARAVGAALREVHNTDGGYLQQRDVDFSGSFILAGQLKTGQLRLFMVYDAGNFIETMGDTTYFQVGEVKYGKPIL
jgi:putative proteasome-type protease